MKLPLETMSGTIWAGIIWAAILPFLVAIIPGGMSGGIGITLAVVIILWLVLFALMAKPTPPKT